jgi:tRNA pseudouridine55 synthase
MDGIILIDKQPFERSSATVRKIKRITGVKKVGHAGTLDPFASGLLIVMLGRATALARFLQAGAKGYRATLLLGTETDTLDPEGKVVRTEPIPRIDVSLIRAEASRFVGKISQIPPAFSAVRCSGKRAYDLARKGLPPVLKARTVTVHRLEILYAVGPVIAMEVHCSSGTYIRSLGAEMAVALSTVGHLIYLRRISCGPYTVEDALGSDLLYKEDCRERLLEALIPMDSALGDMPCVEVDRETALSIGRGVRPSLETILKGSGGIGALNGFVRILFQGHLTAIVRIEGRQERPGVFIERVFPLTEQMN